MLPKGSIQDKLFQQLRWDDKINFMGATYKARFTNGVLKPLEKVDLKEGEEVVFMKSLDSTAPIARPASELSREEVGEVLRRTAGAWAGHADWDEITRMLYEARERGSRSSFDE